MGRVILLLGQQLAIASFLELDRVCLAVACRNLDQITRDGHLSLVVAPGLGNKKGLVERTHACILSSFELIKSIIVYILAV